MEWAMVLLSSFVSIPESFRDTFSAEFSGAVHESRKQSEYAMRCHKC